MPSVIYPTDIQSVLADLASRLQRLENNQANVAQGNALSEITATPNLGGTAAAPYSTTWTNLANSTINFTLTRPARVLMIGHISFAAQSGTSPYGATRMARLAAYSYGENDTLTDVATRDAGWWSSTPYIVEGLGAGASPAAPQTYTVTFQYKMSAGNGLTTLNAATPVLNAFLVG
jgi:hypothetical protein